MVHASSAVALAVVAFGAASTLAYPVVFGDDGLEMRSESDFANIKRAVGQAPLPQGAQGPSATVSADPATAANPGPAGPSGIVGKPPSKAGAAQGALPTVDAIWAPRPTVCKAGEAPHAKNANQRLYIKGKKSSGGRRGRHGGASGAGSRKRGGHKKQGAQDMSPGSFAVPSPTPALLPRAAPVSPSQAQVSSNPGSGGASSASPAPTAPPTKGKPAQGNGKITTTTRKGKDGNTTVYHIHRGTRTLCYTQETGAPGGGQGAPGKADASPSAGSQPPQSTPTGGATKANPQTPAPGAGSSKTPTDPKLVARYEELYERYFGDIDELD